MLGNSMEKKKTTNAHTNTIKNRRKDHKNSFTISSSSNSSSSRILTTFLLLTLTTYPQNNPFSLSSSSFYTSAFSLNMSSSSLSSSSFGKSPVMKDNNRVQLSSTTSSDNASAEDVADEKNKSDEQKKEGSLELLQKSLNNSWMFQLETETLENRKKSFRRVNLDFESHHQNNVKRPILNGHYIKVQPKPLEEPRLVIHSPQVAQALGLTERDVHSHAFLQYVSANLDGFNDNNDSDNVAEAWATPYALSIMGTRYTSNCPFGTGDGYGDGRALSIGEFLINDDNQDGGGTRLELQLKGAGPTPFCRGADGRAVFRSSIREFLASEAMHHLGVSTTRALSLVISPINTSRRPWYSPQNTKQIPDIMNDPRFANKYTKEQLKHILAQINAQTKNDPDMLVEEPNAITCRVSPSFVRVGHLDLFARRATANVEHKKRKKHIDPDEKLDPLVWKELKQLVWHACFREFHDTCYAPYFDKDDIVSASKSLLHHSMDGISTMVAEWIRVGFAQGNFNADNCLIAGRTMDYGPFGFMDEYHPLFAKWTGSGDHFGFMNQANAGYVNFGVLLESIMPIIERYSIDDKDAESFRDSILAEAQKVFTHKVDAVFRKKLGFDPNDESGDEVWGMLEPMLRGTKTDWTVFWRRLTAVAKEYPISADNEDSNVNYEEMLEMLHGNDEVKEGSSPFYEPLPDDVRKKYLIWIKLWRETLEASAYKEKLQNKNVNDETIEISVYERMRLANPKYTLREWMLVNAYTKADSSSMSNSIFEMSNQSTDESEIHNLFRLIQNPYDEGTEEQDLKYYRRAPDKALKQGGTAFMS